MHLQQDRIIIGNATRRTTAESLEQRSNLSREIALRVLRTSTVLLPAPFTSLTSMLHLSPLAPAVLSRLVARALNLMNPSSSFKRVAIHIEKRELERQRRWKDGLHMFPMYNAT